MSEKIIEFKNVNKWYGKFHALKDINLFVNKKDWDSRKGVAADENLNLNLQKLKMFILDSFNQDYSDGKIIDGFWLKNIIKNYFNRDVNEKKLSNSKARVYLSDFCDFWLETESGSIRTVFNSYTSSNNLRNSQQDNRLGSLELFTGSIDDTYATDQDVTNLRGDFNTYTSSNNTTNTTQNSRLSSLETATGSLSGEVSDLRGRVNSLETTSGSHNTRIGDLETFETKVETGLEFTGSNVTIKGSADSGTPTLKVPSGYSKLDHPSAKPYNGKTDPKEMNQYLADMRANQYGQALINAIKEKTGFDLKIIVKKGDNFYGQGDGKRGEEFRKITLEPNAEQHSVKNELKIEELLSPK